MKIERLQAKILRIRLKEGWTISRLTEYYECSPEELRARIMQIYSKGSKKPDRYWKELEANEKIHRQPRTKNASNDNANGGESDAPRADSEQEQKQEQEQDDRAASTADFEEQVNRLRAKESELSQSVIVLEADWYKEKGARQDCLKKLRKFESKIQALRSKISAQYAECQSIISESNTHAERMNAILDDRNGLRKELDEVRDKIAKMSTLELGLSCLGGVVTFGDVGWTLDDSGHEEIFQSIMESDVCAELKLKEIRGMARLIAIIKHAPVETVVIFDNPDAETAYLLLTEAS